VDECVTIVVLDGQSKASGVNVLVTVDKKSAEHWLGQEVEYTIEYGFRIRGDDITT
jgi:hypothetical protein